jgi:tetratricopeptide (TPR) repeat protein
MKSTFSKEIDFAIEMWTKMKTIDERLKEIAQKCLEPWEYSKEGRSVIDNWIYNAAKYSKPRGFYRIFHFLEKGESKSRREREEKRLIQYKKSKKLLQNILDSNINQEETKQSALEIREDLKYITNKTPTIRDDPFFIRNILWQFPDTAESLARELFLNKDSKELSHYGRISDKFDYYDFINYAQYHPGLTKKIIRKMGKVYNIYRKMRKEIAQINLGDNLPSLTSDCISSVFALGREIGLDEEKCYKLSGIKKEDIKLDLNEVRNMFNAGMKIFDPLGAFYDWKVPDGTDIPHQVFQTRT